MTFTKEQLIERARENVKSLKFASTQHAFEKAFPAIEIDIHLAEIALASLEAEPVAVICFDKNYTRRDGSKPNWNEMPKVVSCDWLPDGDYQVYLTAPTAPVSVPDFDEWSRKCDLQIALCDPEFREKARYIWDEACRAAMLQGAAPVTTANKLREGVAAIRNSGIAIDAEKIKAGRDALNSPVIPDGWVLVPKETTPDMLNAAWVSHGIYHASAYRTMLAAAPQQVK